MTSKERARRAFDHQEPDRVPVFEQSIASNVASEILGRDAYTGCGPLGRDVEEMLCKGERDLIVQKICEDTVELYSKLDLDIVRISGAPAKGAKGPKKKLDENTYYYEDKETGFWSVRQYDPVSMMFTTVDSKISREGIPAIEREIEILESQPVQIDETTYETLDYLVAKLAREKYIAGGGCVAIPLDEPWLEAVVLRPDLIERYLDHQLEVTLKSIEIQAKHGVDFILGGADLADNKGPIYSPRHFRRFILPRLKKITEFCHRLGLPYMYRTDGYTWPIAQELFVESGVDGYGEIDRQAGMDIGELKERLPHLVLWGNVDCARTLVQGNVQEVIAETKECIEKGAPGGGYILGSSNTIHPNVLTRNFLAMLDTARRYRGY